MTRDANAPGAYVLVVEHDPVLCKLLRWMLEDEGIRVRSASNGLDALEQAKQQRPSLVILDLGLPILNGEEFATELRHLYRSSDPPVIVVSGDTATSLRARAIGAAAFFQKPFDIDEMASQVAKVLDRAAHVA